MRQAGDPCGSLSLSKGLRQRVALAQALLNSPKDRASDDSEDAPGDRPAPLLRPCYAS